MVTISVSNMTCGGCAKGVLATLQEAVPGVEAKVDPQLREVQVAAAEDAARLIAALRADGWDAVAK
ncbi:heavy metal-associated domain-containing protein [Falsiroseomonas sp.]|uniref:heavy-metal-associated domain-containing protein n=1 Tax=unclassified Falsiroseomonas TaxID=2870720 RepID=UPI002716B9D9|nr:heavy metal-associated domain-containing protein [Falsiroseomonas sp.]MDO9501408.1 heavy metal-associated domain-containing protein [Falsiroseomonas sp.]